MDSSHKAVKCLYLVLKFSSDNENLLFTLFLYISFILMKFKNFSLIKKDVI